MEHKPAEVIRQAREKAEKAILETCGKEILRICDAFSHDTGLGINGIRFGFLDITCIGDDYPKRTPDDVFVDHDGV